MFTPRLIAAAAVVGALAVTADISARQAATPPQPSGSKAVVIKGRAPVSSETLKVKLPRPVEVDLPNGLHLMVLEDRRVPQVTFAFSIQGAGGYFDPAGQTGVATMTATMMREGTASRTTLQIAEALETTASAVTVTAGLSGITATISGSSLTEYVDATLGLAADILLNPTFPQEEFDRYKTRTRTALISQRTQPFFLGNEMFTRVLYGTHPAARVAMTPDALDKVTRDMLVAFHKTHFVPDHAVLAIAGDISLAEARKLVDAKLASWKKAGTPLPAVVDPPPLGPTRVYLVARPGSVQTSLFVGTQGISRTSPDYDVLTVMNDVVGGGPTGRLFTILREEKGYTYGAYSSVAAPMYRGSWLAQTDVRTEVTEPALRDLIAQVARMRDEPVPDKEFQDRKRGNVASFALSLESPAGVLNLHTTRWLYKLPVDYWDKVPDRIGAVTQAAVQQAAKKYLDPGRLQIVAVGDATKIGGLLKQFGTVEMYDTNGKPMGK